MSGQHRTRVLLVSAVTPQSSGIGGALILQRCLIDNASLDCHVAPNSGSLLKRKLFHRLKWGKWRRLAYHLEFLFPALPSHRAIRRQLEQIDAQVIMTVAHGWWYRRAGKVARAAGLPLVVLFQDWWPDSAGLMPLFVAAADVEFRALANGCHTAICVSEGMRRELNAPPNAVVLPDQPSTVSASRALAKDEHPFELIYFGNLQEYGPMVEAVGRLSLGNANLRLQVYGPDPWWDAATEQRLREAGIYHGIISPSDVHSAIQRCHGGLVIMSFDRRMQRRMATSFPSKLIELAQFARPLVVWGPEYCSAVKWAQRNNAALCVTDPDPGALVRAVEDLASDSKEMDRLRAASARAAHEEFNPVTISHRFTELLERAAGTVSTAHAPTNVPG